MKENSSFPKLIYMDGLRASDATFNQYRVSKNLDDAEQLRNLKKKDVLIVENSALMRGRDYRTEEPEGISMLLGKQFTSKRARD